MEAPGTVPVPHPAEGDEIELQALVDVLPMEIQIALRARADWEGLVEVVLDLGRPAEVRFPMRASTLLDRVVTKDDLEHVVDVIREFFCGE